MTKLSSLNLIQKLSIAQALVGSIENFSKRLAVARADGVVTLEEAVDIAYAVVREVLDSSDLGSLPIFTTTKRGPRNTTRAPASDA